MIAQQSGILSRYVYNISSVVFIALCKYFVYSNYNNEQINKYKNGMNFRTFREDEIYSILAFAINLHDSSDRERAIWTAHIDQFVF